MFKCASCLKLLRPGVLTMFDGSLFQLCTAWDSNDNLWQFLVNEAAWLICDIV